MPSGHYSSCFMAWASHMSSVLCVKSWHYEPEELVWNKQNNSLWKNILTSCSLWLYNLSGISLVDYRVLELGRWSSSLGVYGSAVGQRASLHVREGPPDQSPAFSSNLISHSNRPYSKLWPCPVVSVPQDHCAISTGEPLAKPLQEPPSHVITMKLLLDI